MKHREFENKSVAVLGLGIIGGRVANRLTLDGWDMRAWNRTPKPFHGMVSSPEEAVDGASWVSLYLKDSEAVRSVIDSIRPSLARGMVVLNHSTVDLETTMWLDEICRQHRVGFLDAPFTGSRDAAADGRLVYYIGGDRLLAGRADGLLAVSSSSTLVCGPVGAATVVKLATNLVSACTVQALAEGMAIASRHGVEPKKFTEAVAANACGSPLAAMKLPTMANGEFTPHFSLGNMAKDSRYALKLAKAAELETPAITSVSGRMHELAAEGLDALDYSVLAKPYLKPR